MDKYTKAVLTVIATTLIFISAGGEIIFSQQAQAGGNASGAITHMEPDHKGGAFIHWGRSVYHCKETGCAEIAVLDPKG